ncbi:MAG: hypothetical protein ACR2P4_06210 [Gammaproteobacteria bacterium]
MILSKNGAQWQDAVNIMLKFALVAQAARFFVSVGWLVTACFFLQRKAQMTKAQTTDKTSDDASALRAALANSARLFDEIREFL